MHINFQGFLDSLLILVQGWAGIFVVICNLISDILLAIVDPRVKLSES